MTQPTRIVIEVCATGYLVTVHEAGHHPSMAPSLNNMHAFTTINDAISSLPLLIHPLPEPLRADD